MLCFLIRIVRASCPGLPATFQNWFSSTFVIVKQAVIFLLIFLCMSARQSPSVRAWVLAGFAQGTTYRITYYSEDSTFTQSQADSILNSLDSSLSLYKPYSVVNAFNNSAEGIRIDTHLAAVVRKAQEVYTDTEGKFDITIWPLTTAWGFGAQKVSTIPDSAAIGRIMPCIGTDKLWWDGDVLRKKLSCVQLDVNGIAQGYSLDVLGSFMESKGIMNYLVELGGEMRVKGRKQPGDVQMKIQIEVPEHPLSSTGASQQIISVGIGAVTTSGSYRRFYESNGKHITHIIDPRTGQSVRSPLLSVTVIAADAITADAYDNALMTMGMEKALQFAQSRKEIQAYFIYSTPDGNIRDTATRGFYRFMQN